jgi:hypothetical protein
MPVDLGWIQAVELRSAEQPGAAVPTYQNSEKTGTVDLVPASVGWLPG